MRDGVVLVYWLLVMPVDQVFVFSLYATLTMLVHASVLLCRVESNIDLLKYFLVAEHWFCVWDAVLCWWLAFASSSELVMVYTRVGRFMGVCGCLSLQASLREKQLFFFLSLPPTFFWKGSPVAVCAFAVSPPTESCLAAETPPPPVFVLGNNVSPAPRVLVHGVPQCRRDDWNVDLKTASGENFSVKTRLSSI